MRFNIMHRDHDVIVCTPQYARHYEEALKRHYPNHKIFPEKFCSDGQAYLFNEAKLTEMYKTKLELNESTDQTI